MAQITLAPGELQQFAQAREKFAIPTKERALLDRIVQSAPPAALEPPRFDQIDSKAAYSFASRGFADPVEGEAFARSYYSSYFGLPATASLKDMTSAVHGSELDHVAAVNNIAGWTKQVTPQDDAFDQFTTLPQTARQEEAYKKYKASRTTQGLSTDNMMLGFRTGMTPEFEGLSAAQKAEIESRYTAQLRGESPKHRILDAERQLPPSLVRQARVVAATKNADALEALRASAGAEGPKIDQLVNAYMGVYDGNWFAASAHTVGSSFERIKNTLASIGNKIGDALQPYQGRDLYDRIPKDLVTDGGKIASPEAEQKIRSLLRQQSTMPQEQIDNVIKDFENQYNLGKASFETARSAHLSNKTLTQPGASRGFWGDAVQGAIGFLPDMAAASALGAATGGVGSAAYFSSLVNEGYDTAIYEHDLPTDQANAIYMPAAVLQGVLASVALHRFIPLSQATRAEYATALADHLGKGVTKLATGIAKKGAADIAGNTAVMEAMQMVDNAARVASGQADLPSAVRDQIQGLVHTIATAVVFAGPKVVMNSIATGIVAPELKAEGQLAAGDPAKFAQFKKSIETVGIDADAAPASDGLVVDAGKSSAVLEKYRLAATPEEKIAVLRDAGYSNPEAKQAEFDFAATSADNRDAHVTTERTKVVAQAEADKASELARLESEKDRPLKGIEADQQDQAAQPAVLSLVEKLIAKFPALKAILSTEATGPELYDKNGVRQVVEGATDGTRATVFGDAFSNPLEALRKAGHELVHTWINAAGEAVDPFLQNVTAFFGRDNMLDWIGNRGLYGDLTDAELAAEVVSRVGEQVLDGKKLDVKAQGVMEILTNWAKDHLDWTTADEYGQRALAHLARAALRDRTRGRDPQVPDKAKELLNRAHGKSFEEATAAARSTQGEMQFSARVKDGSTGKEFRVLDPELDKESPLSYGKQLLLDRSGRWVLVTGGWHEEAVNEIKKITGQDYNPARVVIDGDNVYIDHVTTAKQLDAAKQAAIESRLTLIHELSPGRQRELYNPAMQFSARQTDQTKLGSPTNEDGQRDLQPSFLFTESAGRGSERSAFHDAISAAKAAHKFGWAVDVKPVEFYNDPTTKLFLAATDDAGVAVGKDGDLVSVFRHPNSTAKIGPILEEAAKYASTLDGFDVGGKLPDLYAKYGFRPVSRVAFDPQYAPEGWNESFGRPDVVFMVHDTQGVTSAPEVTADGYTTVREKVPLFASYDEAKAAQLTAKESAQQANTDRERQFSARPDLSRQINPKMTQLEIEDLVHSISTAVPKGKTPAYDVTKEQVHSTIEQMLKDPEKAKTMAEQLRAMKGFPKVAKEKPEATIRRFHDHVRDNLLWLWDKTPAEVRDRSHLWYDGGRKLATDLSGRYRIERQAAAGVIAALSPQMDWFKNVSLAERLIAIHTQAQDLRVDQRMIDTVNAKKRFTAATKASFKTFIKNTAGQTYAEMSPKDKARFVRLYDEAHHTREYNVITPEGATGDPVRGKDGKKELKAGWGNYGTIAKAIGILENPSVDNISALLGDYNKVRNFYLNILLPNAKNGAITIDTHAVGAGQLLPFSGASKEVRQNFGLASPSNKNLGFKGMYGIYADAFRAAAEARGVLPREMQSVTWEAVRGLFSPEFKRNAQNKLDIKRIWGHYKEGKITIDEARNQVYERANGIQQPEWFGHRPGDVAGAESAGDAGQLSGDGVRGRSAGGVGSGRDSGAAGSVADRVSKTPPRDLRLPPADTQFSARPVEQGDAAVELAYRILRGEKIDPARAKELLGLHYPGTPVTDTLARAKRLASTTDAETKTPKDLIHELRQAEVGLATQERVVREMAQIRSDTMAGNRDKVIAENLKVRTQAEEMRRSITGDNMIEDGEVVPAIEKIVRDSYRAGRERGSVMGLETTIGQVIGQRERELKLTSRAARQNKMEADLSVFEGIRQVLANDADRGEVYAKQKLSEIFGQKNYEKLLTSARLGGDKSATGIVDKLVTAYEDNLRAAWAGQIVTALAKPESRRENLTPAAQEMLDATAAKFKFPLQQARELVKAQGQLKVAKQIAKAGGATTVDVTEAEAAVDGFKTGIADFFERMPFEQIEELHNDLLGAVATSNREKDLNTKMKAADRAGNRITVAGEIQASPSAKQFGEGQNRSRGRPWQWLRGDKNLDLGTTAEIWSGGQGTKTYELLRRNPVLAEESANLMEHKLKADLWAKADELGFTQDDVLVRWRYDRKPRSVGGEILLMSTDDILDIYNSLKDPTTVVELGRAKLKSAIDYNASYGVKFSDAEHAERALRHMIELETTPEQRQLADFMFDALHTPEVIKGLNDVSYWRGGTHEFDNPYYWPRERDVSDSPLRKPSDSLDEFRSSRGRSLDNAGITQRRHSSKRDVLYRGAVEKYMDHVGDVSRITHLTIPLSDAKTVLQAREVNQAITEKFGNAGIKFVLDTYAKMGGVMPAETGAFNNVRRTLENNLMLTMWGRLSSFVKARAGGSVLALTELEGQYGHGAAVEFGKVVGTSGPSQLFWKNAENAAAREALLRNGYFVRRFQDHPLEIFGQTFRPGIEDAKDPAILQRMNKLGEAYGLAKSKWAKVKAFGMNPLMEADAKTAVATYRAIRAQGYGEAEAVQRTADIIRATQPAASAADETALYRDVRPLWLVFPFLGAPSRAAAMLKRDIIRHENAAGTPAQAKATKQMVLTAIGVLAQAAIGVGISRAAYSITTGKPFIPGEDDRQSDVAVKLIGESLDSTFLPGSGRLLTGIADAFGKGDLGDLSIAERPLNDIARASRFLAGAYQDEELDYSDPKVQDAVRKLVEGASILAGLPLPGPIADVRLLKGALGGNEE
ncbi:MAG: hypothetical protein WCS70_09060 [Verrucomicrobiota bacterium]